MSEPKVRRPLRRVALRLGVLVLAAGLAILATEAFARLADPFGISYYRDTNRYFNEAIALPPDAARPDGRLFENAPDVTVPLRTFTFRTEGNGLRTSGAARPTEADGLRLLFLGDSVTLAWGVEDEASWIRLLETEARSRAGEPLVCMNAGHLQYNTLQETDWLAAHAEALHPDAVVLTVVVNDTDDAYGTFLQLMTELQQQKPPEEWTLTEKVQARLPVWFRGLAGLDQFRDEQRTARTAEERSGERLEDTEGYAEGWERVRAGLERARDVCAARGIPLVVLDHTTPRIPDVRRWCEEQGVAVHSFEFTPEEWSLDLRNSAADAHANELGNRLLADKAWRVLADEGLLAAPPDRAGGTPGAGG